MVCLVEPGCFRQLHSFVQQVSEGQGRLEVLALAATDNSDTSHRFDTAGAAPAPGQQRQAAAPPNTR